MRLSPRRCFQWTQRQGTGTEPLRLPSSKVTQLQAAPLQPRSTLRTPAGDLLRRPALVRRAQRSMPAALAAQRACRPKACGGACSSPAVAGTALTATAAMVTCQQPWQSRWANKTGPHDLMQPSNFRGGLCQFALPTYYQAYWGKMHMQVLASSPPRADSASAFLPDGLPGQVHSSGSGSTAAGEPFSLFSVPIAAQGEQMAGRQQQLPQHSRSDEGHESAEQQVLIQYAMPVWNLPMCIATGGPQARVCHQC